MRWFIIFLFSLSSFYCAAQKYYESYTPANGLVDARVNKMMQDGSGRIFFLTRDGVSIYDGQRFINHTKFNGAPIGIIEDAILLPGGNLRLATFNGNWITIQENSDDLDTLIFKSIQEVSAIIPLENKEQLIVSNHGLFINKLSAPEVLTNIATLQNRFYGIVAISGDAIVYSYSPGNTPVIYTCNKRTGSVTDSLQLPYIYSAATDKDGNIFICTAEGVVLLNKELLRRGRLRMESPGFQKFLPQRFTVNQLFFDNQKNIWLISSSEGCRKINPLTGEIASYSPDDGLFPGVTSIFQDKENNYWFIASGKGVQKLVQTNFEMVNQIGNRAIPKVTTLTESGDGSLLFLTAQNILQLKKDRVTEYPRQADGYPEPFFMWQNNLWQYPLASYLVNNHNQKINIENVKATGNVFHFPSPHVGFDKKGNLLLSGNRFVLVQKNHKAESYDLPYFADNILVDDENNYWVFCRNNEVVKFALTGDKLVKESSFSHPGLEPRFAAPWNKDTFLLATRSNGILIIKVDSKSLAITGRLTREQGLSNDFVATLLVLDKKSIAAGTAAGLDIITIAGTDTVIENVSARINHFEPILQLARNDKGMVYARTENLQVFRYDPFSLSATNYQPGAWLNQVIVNGKSVPVSSKRFSYNENNFHFAVSSPSFIGNRSIVFRFVLTGEKKTWEQSSNKADFEIANLPSGKYELTCTVKYPGNIYPDKIITSQFIIKPPFWKTWWFLSALIALFLVSVLALTRAYLQKQIQKKKVIMEKELAIEQERTRMARDLHDGLGSMLSGIKHSFTAMKNQVTLNEDQETKFQYNISKLNESIVELRDISHSMASDSLLKYGLANSLSDYCRNISQPGEFVISFEALDTEKMYLTEEQSFHIFRIVQELLHNIIKHSGATSAILQLSYNNKRLYITVEDNGKGFEMNDPTRRKGIGLKNIESRIKTLKGKMDYRTAPSTGTSVLIEIPIL